MPRARGGWGASRLEAAALLVTALTIAARLTMMSGRGPMHWHSGSGPGDAVQASGGRRHARRKSGSSSGSSSEGYPNPYPPVADIKISALSLPPSREMQIKQLEKQMMGGVNSARRRAAEGRKGGRKGIGNGAEELETWRRKKQKRVTAEEAVASWDVLKRVKRLGEETPLLLNMAQFMGESSEQLERDWLEYQGENGTAVYHYPKSLIRLLPDQDSAWHFETCAVVGNSGVLLLKSNGEEIDKHDAVFRINLASLRGFGQWAGRKSTFNVVNAHNVKEMLLGPSKDKFIAGAGHPEHVVMFETAAPDVRQHILLPLLQKEPSALLLNPLIVNSFHTVWIQLRFLLEQESDRNFNRKPMSGFFTLMFALQVCDHVNLYGFDSYQGKNRSYRYHYFDNIQGFTARHSFDLAFEVFKIMSDQGLLAIQI